MSELKPCVNDNCYWNDGTGCFGNVHINEECGKYLTEKPESAWEMFRGLNRKYKHLFINALSKWMKLKSVNLYEIAGYFLFTSNSIQAINIMQEIEKDLK